MTSSGNLREAVIAAIAESCHMQPADLSPGLSLAELSLDSLGILSIVTAVENSAQCRFEPDDLLPLFEAADVRELTDGLLRLAEEAIAP